ncbi:serine/arginine repetitive matrix protein 2 isoform X1 [Stomoxys calcitrans]|uniref:serine/arginine repetitive matrix protein 2 isoform X1 n=1 Tax=Stomoxys calcitrans TaxID=35570 RepID=UPI0027E39D6C|nr:serine/arginine repetitive matrix protein 2 isoform X1 [Stomoxys calcitrans]XP_059217128.1 serine/arginine repetitive matrix protein 2 isoform X1 [Stomoxys calcitrans]XP_059217135.1 serine/arginine repetitive matrix protein 2 isoform X1 [Stomoxys calcitrans]XP_059217143.1 serine/arginine repetitive matrix protein 2 isoform X1 [Stomoxys calcitrans]XP_059217147.1 serine/arginine repetitive matrix protein 2 isoform X1 [Stomoxys calcitrans]XP_059217151.1 serine/arginine repetitive matrix protei
MGNGMNKVLPGLYVGNYRDSKDTQQLDKFQITHIVAIHDSPRRLLPDKHYLCVMAADTPDQNLSQYFTVCNDFIHAARLREGNVLIHCLAGMSRSVTVAVAYIMTATNLSWKDALKVVRAGRAVANPNVGFQTQLQEFEMYRLSEERRRLRERYPSMALEKLDRIKCMAALDNYEELLQNRDICEGNCVRGEKCPTGVCNMDPTKGLFRRRPSSASTRSRLRPQVSTPGVTTAQSCPNSPKHSGQGVGARRSLGGERIPEDEEAHLSPTTSSEAAEYAAAVEASKKEAQERQQQRQLQRSPSRNSTRSPRVSSAGSRLTGNATKADNSPKAQRSNNGATGGAAAGAKSGGSSSGGGSNGAANLQRSASTVSGLAVRPRSSPAGLHSYTGSVPSSVHGSRVDLRDTDKGSAIYLGCTAPRNSTLSLASSGSSAPPSPARTPPVSPRHGVRRSASLVKKTR